MGDNIGSGSGSVTYCFVTLKDKLSCTTQVERKTLTNGTRTDVMLITQLTLFHNFTHNAMVIKSNIESLKFYMRQKLQHCKQKVSGSSVNDDRLSGRPHETSRNPLQRVSGFFKVHVFREGHKILRNPHHRFDCQYYVRQI